MATPLVQVKFDFAQCRKQVNELGALLLRPELSEKDDILPFFRARDQLCAFIGTYAPEIGRDLHIAREFSLVGDFTADLVVGSKDRSAHLAVEFEDGRRQSIFRTVQGRTTKEWSPRFEHGYSQIIDWFATLDDFKKTDKFEREFGKGHVTFTGLLVVGRDSGVSDDDRVRLKWRSNRVVVDSHRIYCVTFDDLYRTLRDRLQVYTVPGRQKKK